MERVYNFSAGPANLPLEVIEKAQNELSDFNDSGMSVMELSHRSKIYEDIHNETKEKLLKLMSLGDDYELLFLQGGAYTQFVTIPMNYLDDKSSAAYINTGSWTAKAIEEAKFFGNVEVIASSEKDHFTYIPEIPEINKDYKYLYICTNNTIYGTRYAKDKLPNSPVPLLADMSSNILSENYDMTKFDLIFAGAQKNLGISGVTIVAIKKDFLTKSAENLPTMFDYKIHAEKNSLYNTPPTFAIYITGLMAKWLINQGGVEEIEKMNIEKAGKLYDFIDNSKIFKNNIKKEDRSLMNVIFFTGSKDLDAAFLKGAEKEGLFNLKGHRSVGGMRASIYNAMPMDGVESLIDYMKKFEMENKQEA